MLLLGAILLAIFVLPSPWGIVAIVAGGLIDISESVVLFKWSRRRRAVTGVEALVGETAVVSSSPTQVRVVGELWEATSDVPLVAGEEVKVTGVDGLTLRVSPRSRVPRWPPR
jgi:membrane protein implicated in regulation of membrane protease activity